MKNDFRLAFIAVLHDENGINATAYFLLIDYAQQNQIDIEDICNVTQRQSDGRRYLTSYHADKLLQK